MFLKWESLLWHSCRMGVNSRFKGKCCGMQVGHVMKAAQWWLWPPSYNGVISDSLDTSRLGKLSLLWKMVLSFCRQFSKSIFPYHVDTPRFQRLHIMYLTWKFEILYKFGTCKLWVKEVIDVQMSLPMGRFWIVFLISLICVVCQ